MQNKPLQDADGRQAEEGQLSEVVVCHTKEFAF